MIFAFVRSLIGSVGREIMDFYLQNSLWINLIILMYAGLAALARMNYQKAVYIIISELAVDLSKKNQSVKSRELERINWEMVRKKINFPLISNPKAMYFVILTKKYLQKEFTLEIINQFLKSNKDRRK